MSWWGKVLGGTFGFMLGGPLGAILGAALGHNFDKGLAGVGEAGWQAGSGDQERVQMAFFTATFSVMGYLAKADGRVTEDEIGLARAVMAQMKLSPELRQTAIHLFNEGKGADFPLDEVLEQFRVEVHRRRNLVRMFIEIQLQAAYADGELHPAERRSLLHICQRLGFPASDYARLEAMIGAERQYRAGTAGPSIEAAYAVLNISPDTSDAEVKKAYRRLMSQHHPDKLVSKGLPEEMMEIAKQKTQEIRRAYEQVRDARGI